MGDWCTTHHWFECPTASDARQVLGRLRAAATSYRWPDRERWGLRAGLVAPRLVQAESLVKYGASFALAAFVRERVPAARSLQLCAGYRQLAVDLGPGALQPAWNYLVVRTGVDRRRLADATGGRAPDGAPDLVCLPEPVPLTADFTADARLAAVVAVLQACVGRERARLVLGLWTLAHGWLHLARLELGPPGAYWPPGGDAELTLDGGGHNACPFSVEIGPMIRSTYSERPPTIAAPRAPWPFST
ncbi:hypothetical protein [Nannocystis radixulma]|uniref:Uncharacterized protein n=1 Tax=Nannocystis radixulma TaxID=2995305 RepID=A0ABT5B3A8_9BACT|nr:hypothetical protein [Nannocystis radixulma]MDC0668570.1 hypothetical protein [Nannocystis radixulma]